MERIGKGAGALTLLIVLAFLSSKASVVNQIEHSSDSEADVTEAEKQMHTTCLPIDDTDEDDEDTSTSSSDESSSESEEEVTTTKPQWSKPKHIGRSLDDPDYAVPGKYVPVMEKPEELTSTASSTPSSTLTSSKDTSKNQQGVTPALKWSKPKPISQSLKGTDQGVSGELTKKNMNYVRLTNNRRMNRKVYDEVDDNSVTDENNKNESPKPYKKSSSSRQNGRSIFVRSKPRAHPPQRQHPPPQRHQPPPKRHPPHHPARQQNRPAARPGWHRPNGRSFNEIVIDKKLLNDSNFEISDSNSLTDGNSTRNVTTVSLSPLQNKTAPAPEHIPVLEGGISCEIRKDFGDSSNGLDRKWTQVNIFAPKDYPDQHIKLLNESLQIFREAAPCLPINLLREGTDGKPTNGSYLELDYEHTGPCYSYIGRTKMGQQMLGLPPSCMTPDLIAHEFMHALGFDHEQNRPDRDEFVEINWHNFYPGENIFKNYEINPVAPAIGPYDFGSILHFKPIGNTIEEDPTMVSKTGEPLGNIDGKMTQLDKEKIRLLYCPHLNPVTKPCKDKLAKYFEKPIPVEVSRKKVVINENLNKTTTDLNKTTTELNKTPTGLNKTTIGLNKTTTGLKKTTTGLNKTPTALNKTTTDINKTTKVT